MASGRNFAQSGQLRRPRALVVESDSQIAASIEDTLSALEHGYDIATNRCDARRMLSQTDYSYVLLNLKIPARPHRGVATTEFGMLLLEDVRKSNGHKRLPTVVMVERDLAYLEMVGELVANGASEFVTIPFPQTGHTLLKAIRRVLKRRRQPLRNGCRRPKTAEKNGVPGPFRGGELVFFPSRVELCGVKICDGVGLARSVLDALRGKDSRGKFVALSGEELAEVIGSEGGPPAVAGAIRNFRNRVQRTMLVEANVAIDPAADLIVNDRQYGYRLSEKIAVVERTGLAADELDEGQGDRADDPEAARPPFHHCRAGENQGDELDCWLLAELKKTGSVRRSQIVQRTGWSDSTVRRALARLRDEGKVAFEGSARSGYWRLA